MERRTRSSRNRRSRRNSRNNSRNSSQNNSRNSSLSRPQQNGRKYSMDNGIEPEIISNLPGTSNKSSKTAAKNNRKSFKMRELNRKGVEKEGSDMDAFTTEALVPEEKERPSTPPSPSTPTPTIKMPPTPPPSVPEPSIPFSAVDKIKEDLEKKEDKLVAARNEENAKVSSLNKPEDEPVQVIEKPRSSQITLRHSYHKDQWSPLNPEGKKKYERDFLLDLKKEPQSNRKPENLPDVVALTRDVSNNRGGNINMNMFSMNNNITGALVPAFLQRTSQSQRGMPPKRGSQQGSKSKSNSKMINISLSLNEDVKLKTSENAWKPTRLDTAADKPEEDKQTEELYKNVRGILNKLTPQKFDTLMKKFMKLPISSEHRLKGVINLIFDKAVDEPCFSKAYANMCKMLAKLEVTKNENNEEKVNFRKILITRCQTEFETNKSDLLESEKCMEEINSCTDPEKKKELQLAFEEKERAIRRKSVGNIRFIGELFKLGMLTPAIMYRCIEHLLSTPEEESLECLCKLLTTIGKDLELGAPNSKPPQVSLNIYFQKMSELAQKREGSKVSSRVRFMLQDVIELRQNKWVPRREDNNPKTIEQINKEAEREVIEQAIALAQPPRMNRQNDRQDDRKRGNRGNNQSEDGWNTVPTGRYSNKFAPFEAAKMQSIKTDDVATLSLGGSSMFTRFGNTGAKMDSKAGPGIASSNFFSALSNDRNKPPQPSMNNRRITSTPSIERDKERQRMIQGAMESDGRNSRGSSAQRDRPLPTSRDSSVGADKESRGRAKDEERQPPIDEKEARLAEEKLERQTNSIFDEFLANLITAEEVKREIEQLYPGDKIGEFVGKALSICLEKKFGTQHVIGLLLATLMESNHFGADVVVEQFRLIYEMAEDISIDVPKVWELQAHVIVPLFAVEKVDFSHFKAACSPVLKTISAQKLLIPVLNLLVKEKSAGFLRKVWDSSNVSLADFLPAEVGLDAFIRENSLEYLTGDAPKYDNSLPMDQLQDKILRLMRNNQPYESILEFIQISINDPNQQGLETPADKSVEDKRTEELYNNVTGNKLTLQKFDTLMRKLMKLPISSEHRLKGVTNLIFDKAVEDQRFSEVYANMCKMLAKLEVPKIEKNEEKVNFRKILITRCQTEFETNKSDLLDSEKCMEEINRCTDPEKKNELQLAFDEKERAIRRKSVGNIRFIGELFKLGMLNPAIMYRCIEHLLNTPEEESLECLCILLTTIGKNLELGTPYSKPLQVSQNIYFQKMSELAQKREGSKVSPEVQFMLQEVIELRQNNWVPRGQEDNNPKMIEDRKRGNRPDTLE